MAKKELKVSSALVKATASLPAIDVAAVVAWRWQRSGGAQVIVVSLEVIVRAVQISFRPSGGLIDKRPYQTQIVMFGIMFIFQ